MSKYVMPDAIFGKPQFPLGWPELNWLQLLPKDTFFSLYTNLPSLSRSPQNLPRGYELYVITFHQERFDAEWILEQTSRIKEPIIILNDGSCYDLPLPPNATFFNYYSWHHHVNTIIDWFPFSQARSIKYKASAVCNRITQSKLIVFTALMQYLSPDQRLVTLNTWLEPKNVHNWQPTGVAMLDDLTNIFQERYLGQVIKIDDFDQSHNIQSINSNPWQPMYLESALHFTNESYHYSLMQHDGKTLTMPGPSYSEKTFKCLVAGTPFIAVGQFDSYRWLESLGLKFNYGMIDLSWDKDSGNLARLVSIVKLIKELEKFSIADIISATQESTDHNTHMIWSGEFAKNCQAHNQSVIDTILSKYA